MRLKTDNLDFDTCISDFYITLNKTLDLSNRLILSTTKHKDPIILNYNNIRTHTKNQHYLNYRKYINSYELVATINKLLEILNKLGITRNTLQLNDTSMNRDISNSMERLEELKKQISKET